jgi:hypothetical protein
MATARLKRKAQKPLAFLALGVLAAGLSGASLTVLFALAHP